MSKCKQCGKDYKGKRSTSAYCSSACKQEFYRNRIRDDVTISDAKPVTVTSLEKCQYCGVQLPALQKPRQHPGACYNCAIKQPSKPVSPVRDGHTLSSRPALEFTTTLTDYEREHYKPANELRPSQYNPVSKPGDDHYSVFKKRQGVGLGGGRGAVGGNR